MSTFYTGGLAAQLAIIIGVTFCDAKAFPHCATAFDHKHLLLLKGPLAAPKVSISPFC